VEVRPPQHRRPTTRVLVLTRSVLMAPLLPPHHPPPVRQKGQLDHRRLAHQKHLQGHRRVLPKAHHCLAVILKFVQLKMCSITRHQQTTKKETWYVSGQSGSSAEDGLMDCGVTSPLTPLPSSLEFGVMRGLRMVTVVNLLQFPRHKV